MFDQIEAELGPVSILVNNAGIALPGDFLETPLEQFQKVIDVNLTGTFLAVQRAAKTMVAEGIEGAIVNMSSINAQVAIPSIAAYCASKGGVMQLTKAVGPGARPAQHSRQRGRARLHRHRDDGGRERQPRRDEDGDVAHPLKRVGTPREIGNVVAFLASRQGELHHRRDDLCRWRTAGDELYLLKRAGDFRRKVAVEGGFERAAETLALLGEAVQALYVPAQVARSMANLHSGRRLLPE